MEVMQNDSLSGTPGPGLRLMVVLVVMTLPKAYQAQACAVLQK